MQPGTRVTLKRGWWYYNPTHLEGLTATGDEVGTVDKRQHLHGGTVFVTLDDGRFLSAARSGLEEVADAN